MVNIISISMAALALAFPAVALPASLQPRASSGCTVNLASTMTTPSAPGEIITMKTMIKWTDWTDMSSFDSSYCDWSHTAKAPYSVFFKADTIPGYETLDELSTVLQPWVDSWLIAGKSGEPNSGVTGDYNITGVTCA
ncbi:hypothetical protein IWX49DRAFT_639675 [Phyllosticta citricarpa]|uniref:Uncharacterized protein n=2 Tax=Phyllosticta TaxID=121621 RepID=A0ABR1LH87_9PEZI